MGIASVGCWTSAPADDAVGRVSSQQASTKHDSQVARPVAVSTWTFDEIPTGEVHGEVSIVRSGPAPPRFTDFVKGNRALQLRAPSYIVLPSPSAVSDNFTNGDSITVAAWVNVKSLSDNAYIVGKGRTEKSGLKSRDQNWAVRLRKRNGLACLNFLFHSQDNDAVAGAWHRWTSRVGFGVDSHWHHVAVTYTFGDPDSIAGFVDGRPTDGDWDMGGATMTPPMQTDSPVWIGSAMAGNRGNSFDGQIDQLSIYRERVSDEELRRQFNYVAPEIKRPVVAAQRVAVQLLGPFSAISRIDPELVEPQTTWQQSSLAFTRLPLKYDDWGVRTDWTTDKNKSMLVRAWTDVPLEPGDYQLMVRSRGYSELYVDGKQVLSTPAQVNRSGAHHVVDPIPSVPVAGMRPHGMNDHERIVDFCTDGGEHEFRFDVIVGGPKYRLEFGETCVAIARKGELFSLISHQSSYPLTDDGWQRFVDQQSTQLDRLDRQSRRDQMATQQAFWDKRHEFAKQRLMSGDAVHFTDAPNSAVSVSAVSVDALITDRIEQENRRRSALAANARDQDDSHYTDHVLPILQTHCARCHDTKRQGDLSVMDRDSMLAGGESGDPAIVPFDPDASYLIELVSAAPDDYRMPPKGDGLSADEVAVLRKWVGDGARMPMENKPPIELTAAVDDATFLRRIFIDTVGVPPTWKEANEFLSDTSADRRRRLIDRLLDDPRWADNWVGYWQDVLAENPNLLKPTLNNTGPFRYWIHEALQDNKPIDWFATELIQMRGSRWYGGAGGFQIASQNDVPMAAKAHVIATAFMGVEMKCARCHDAPYHSWKQSDLFNLAAMLRREPITLPDSSTVPVAFFEAQDRQPLIEVTLKPGETIHGEWPFATLSPQLESKWLPQPADSRDRLALQVTASRRFAEVIGNRIWKRLMGAGVVEPVDDWQGNAPSDPKLLAWLADTLIANDYDVKRLAQAIFQSDVYARAANRSIDEGRFFAGPYRRRMSAEQIVDSAFHVVGQRMRTEQLTMDIEGTLPEDRFLNFGFPQRSWEFTTLANERDRPSLALPRIQAIADVLKAFGWRNSRPEPTSRREETPNLVQPGALANGTLGVWLTRLSDESGLTDVMLDDQSVEALVDHLFLQILTRRPTDDERNKFVSLLRDGYGDRVRSLSMSEIAAPPKRFRYVSWSNHLNTQANVIKVEMTELARQGPPPTKRLQADWRRRAEDAVWALINSPEMIVIP